MYYAHYNRMIMKIKAIAQAFYFDRSVTNNEVCMRLNSKFIKSLNFKPIVRSISQKALSKKNFFNCTFFKSRFMMKFIKKRKWKILHSWRQIERACHVSVKRKKNNEEFFLRFGCQGQRTFLSVGASMTIKKPLKAFHNEC